MRLIIRLHKLGLEGQRTDRYTLGRPLIDSQNYFSKMYMKLNAQPKTSDCHN